MSPANEVADKRPIVDFDHNSEEHARDRTGSFDRLRRAGAECPVVHTNAHGGYGVIVGMDMCRAVLADPETYSSRDMPGIPPFPLPLGMTYADPPMINDVRKKLNRHFSRLHAEETRAHVQEVVDRQLEIYLGGEDSDAVENFTRPVPAVLTMQLLGLPDDGIAEYVRVFSRVLSPLRNSDPNAVMEDYLNLLEWVGHTVDARMASPRKDWISLLVEVFEDHPNPRGQVIENVNLLLAGGIDTTTNVTTFTLLHLSRDSSFRQSLQNDSSLLGSAFDEFVRIVTPQQTLPRRATTASRLTGVDVVADERLLLALGAANRDPEYFDRPNDIVINRKPNRHIAFGVGVHTCLGRHFARTWWEVMVTSFLRRAPDFTVREDLVEYTKANTNGILKLPITFDAA